jgi:uncharacterized protein (TIGR02145 family)
MSKPQLKLNAAVLVMALLIGAPGRAQVTIGGMTDPKDGALLDLNSTAKGVLLLSNVSLTDLEKIPGGVFVGIANEQDKNTELTGAIVYNTNATIGVGLYIWNGDKWTMLTGNVHPGTPFAPGEAGTMIDDRDGEGYYTGDFGTAGIWMLENLRYIPAAVDGYSGYTHSADASTNPADKYYAYPGTDMDPYDIGTAKNGWDKSWGVFYNWAGATNGRSIPSEDETDWSYDDGHPKVRGVCPEGWYLPSDWDWNNLEQVIADAAANVYSTEGKNTDMTSGFRTSIGFRNPPLGRKMKSTKDVNTTDGFLTNGSSKSAATGGFDALLVGAAYDGVRGLLGTYTYFRSSSSDAELGAWSRDLSYGDPGLHRGNFDRSDLFSVRCKKD